MYSLSLTIVTSVTCKEAKDILSPGIPNKCFCFIIFNGSIVYIGTLRKILILESSKLD